MMITLTDSGHRLSNPSLFWRHLCLLLLLTSGIATAATTDPDPEQSFFDPTFGDFSEEIETAKTEGKKGVLLMFEMDECPFCQRMKTTVLNQPEVREYFKKHFKIFSVDIEGDVEITDFSGTVMTQKDFALKSYRVRATPVFAFFDVEGNLMTKFIGATPHSSEFMWLGNYVVEDRYKDTTFQQYKRERQAAPEQ
ncbi:thioredoxin family protein [uncultured Thiocystis sp.]|jgi:thioredoxin-related protein|uniref:thioredoxin family protein n=1 Tax=uncultured Thiocystis sp. TaxID=1202134 RepID=UPI0025D97F03|nr:thioredoxin family protein [uncultured Thiocystis sp.]